MQDKSIFLVVGAILASGIMIAAAIVYNGTEYRKTNQIAETDTMDQDNSLINYDANLELELAEDDPYEGSKSKSQIAIVEFSDYECPFCQQFHNKARREILEKYVQSEQAILVWKDLPLSFHDPLATKQAIAAQCVNKVANKEAYFKMSDAIFEATTSNGRGMKESQLEELAQDIEGVDIDEYKDCYESEATKEKVEQNIELAARMGISGTPGFVIGKLEDGKVVNGVRVSGALPFASFEEVIEGLLE